MKGRYNVWIFLSIIFLWHIKMGTCENASTSSDSIQPQLGQKTMDAAYVNNIIALSIYPHISKNNFVFSPLSVSNILAMLYTGSKDSAKIEFEENFYFDSSFLNEGLLHVREFVMDGVENSSNHTFLLLNAIVACSNFSIDKEYEKDLKYFYNAEFLKYDPTSSSASVVQIVNSWFSNKTSGKIKAVARKPPSTYAGVMFMNTIYFKAPWREPFSPMRTMIKTFYNFDSDPVEIPMMCQSIRTYYGYHPKFDSHILELPYEDMEVDMIFILPNLRTSLPEVESSLSLEAYEEIHAMTEFRDVEVEIPIFRIWHSLVLPRILKHNGIHNVFVPGESFSSISPDEDIYVSEMIHKGVFSVNEFGTEVTGVTFVELYRQTVKPTFNVDRPFMFIVRHRWTNAILFIGRVMEL